MEQITDTNRTRLDICPNCSKKTQLVWSEDFEEYICEECQRFLNEFAAVYVAIAGDNAATEEQVDKILDCLGIYE